MQDLRRREQPGRSCSPANGYPHLQLAASEQYNYCGSVKQIGKWKDSCNQLGQTKCRQMSSTAHAADRLSTTVGLDQRANDKGLCRKFVCDFVKREAEVCRGPAAVQRLSTPTKKANLPTRARRIQTQLKPRTRFA